MKKTVITHIEPQPGPQKDFLSSLADIVIYGGAAGAGKTYGLLLEAVRMTKNSGYGAVIFRRESTQITNEGGLWDTAMGLYPRIGGTPIKSPTMRFVFPAGSRVTFAHLNQESDVLSWQGAQIPMIGFDELTHFTQTQFFYMLSRNRSTCGVRPYIRATCNADADSWVASFIGWWIGDDGFPIPGRGGQVRWFVRINDQTLWADSAKELVDQYGVGPEDPKSFTFIPGKLTDNKALMKLDPGYMANLKALSFVERSRLLDGNWKVRPAAGLYFNRSQAPILEIVPSDVAMWVRSWDLASTIPAEANPNPDATVGLKMGRRRNGRYVVVHVERIQKAAHDVRDCVKNTAAQDGGNVKIVIPQDPGQAGKEQIASYVLMLSGYNVKSFIQSGDKIVRAEPVAAQWQAGNIDVVRGPWNESFFAELEAFFDKRYKDDQVDALSGAFNAIVGGSGIVEHISAGGTRITSSAMRNY